ncbi:GspE/PulE family protein [Candidatus Laterigemmans baculatus]|uniref:GspE/PulE family protein n=1 Tax=Candidatus Laterigemmans baculatus TaxID=2770505 RepID=UPI0013DBA01C|nr:GspE/PulE family protein [Candidatus Laterigemmans baculatus]
MAQITNRERSPGSSERGPFDPARFDPRSPEYAVQVANHLLRAAVAAGASDVHLQPTPAGIEVAYRIDGVLQPTGILASGEGTDPIARLKVMAGLLTYASGRPQEGRLQTAVENVEMRISTFPTIHGERTVIRLFGREAELRRLDDLGLSRPVRETLAELLLEQDGAILVTGPAGSGKTTTLYAAARELIGASSHRRAVLSIEDPVETVLSGASQSQLDPSTGMTLAAAVRSMLRQDPEVLLIGEIRDPETAEAALQASLTGHLVLTSFHAGDAAMALRRLVEMGVATYLIRSGVRAVLSQRLLRRLCDCRRSVDPAVTGLAVSAAWEAVGCQRCFQTGYRGRVLASELLRLDSGAVAEAVAAPIDQHRSADEIRTAAVGAGMQDLRHGVLARVAAGETSPAEALRVLGSRISP